MKAKLKVAGRALLAAVTSPQAVTMEKGLALFVITRVLLAVGASAGLIELVSKVLGS